MRKGISLLELIVALTAGGVLLGAILTYFSSMFGRDSASTKRAAVELEVLMAMDHVLKAGRIATSCTSSAPTVLRCAIDFELPPVGNARQVEFLLSAADATLCVGTEPPCLAYQELISGAWVVKRSYAGIADFKVCDSPAVNGGSCTLASAAFSTTFSRNITNNATATNRFFILQITGTPPRGAGPRIVQSAFFVRNPTGIGSLVYNTGITN